MATKIPFYNIVNFVLTGFIFLGCLTVLFPNQTNQIMTSSLVTNLSAGVTTILTVSMFAIVYEVGLIINRLGSVLIEPILKGIKAIPFDNDYMKFNEAKKEFPIMTTLSREYALSRTGIALFLILIVICLFSGKWVFSGTFILAAILYFFSCRKHAKKIVTLMNDDKK